MGTRRSAAVLASAALLALLALLALGPGANAAPVTTTTADGGAPPPTTTTTRPTTTTTRATTSTTRATTSTSQATTSTTEPPSTTSAPTTTPTTIRPAEEFEETDDESTTTSEAPPPSIVKPAPPSVDIVAGTTVQVPVETDDVFDPDVDPEVTLSTTGDDATTVQAIVTASVDPDTGELTISVEVPEDTPESIITVTITAVDSRGVSRTIVYLFPVKPAPSSTPDTLEGPSAAAVGGAGASNGVRWSELPVVPDAEVPAVVKAIQASIPDEATEQALLAELKAEPESVLYLDDATYAVSVRPLEEAQGTARGLVAAISLAAASIGLIALRRRTLAAQLKGSR